MKFNKNFLLAASLFVNAISYSQTGYSPDTIKSDDKTFEKVEIEASYPGGEAAWRKFLEQNLNPNVPVDNGAPVGRYTVIIQFVVAKDGKVSDVKALTSLGYGTEAEVIRLMKKSGAWNPATQGGRFVNAYRKQPVTFVVQQDGFDIITKVPYTLFTGTDNEIMIEVHKLKSEDMSAIISQGTIIPKGNGNFIVKVNKPGKAIITVFGKKNKEIARAYFEVISPKE